MLVAGYCIVQYRDALLSFFFLDDFWSLREAAAMTWDTPLDDLVRVFKPTHVGFLMYRPLTQRGYFALLRALFGCDASGYHAVQLLAFTWCALLVFGIARRLTDSIRAGLAASLIYAAAPGHALTVFWIAIFTMMGPALVVLLMVWAWLRIATPVWRVAVCTTLQVIGLLAGEHAVCGPILLALVAWRSSRREPWRRQALLLLPSFALVGAYVLLKVWYLTAVSTPYRAYIPSHNPVQWLMNAGHYALGSLNILKLQRSAEPGSASLVVGAALVLLMIAAAWRAQQSRAGWRLLAIGLAVFLVALVPVVVLPAHFYDYYVGIAALGVGLAVVAACQLVAPRAWRSLALASAAGLILFDIVTGQRAAREDPIFLLCIGGGRNGAAWVEAVAAVSDEPGLLDVAVPRDGTTNSVFGFGRAERVFPGMPPRVSLFRPTSVPAQGTGRVIVSAPAPSAAQTGPIEHLPCWDARWKWLRQIARW